MRLLNKIEEQLEFKFIKEMREEKVAKETFYGMITTLGVMLLPLMTYTTNLYIKNQIYNESIEGIKNDIIKVGDLAQYISNLF